MLIISFNEKQLQTDQRRPMRKPRSSAGLVRLLCMDPGVGKMALFKGQHSKLYAAVTNSKGVLPPSKDPHDYLSFAP
jgi:hypothetical protein